MSGLFFYEISFAKNITAKFRNSHLSAANRLGKFSQMSGLFFYEISFAKNITAKFRNSHLSAANRLRKFSQMLRGYFFWSFVRKKYHREIS